MGDTSDKKPSTTEEGDLEDVEQKYTECYGRLQAVSPGGSFETNYGLEICRLSALITHFNRWGTAMGFTKISTSSPSTEERSKRLSGNSAMEEESVFKDTATEEETRTQDPKTQIAKSTEGVQSLYAGLQRINVSRAPTKGLPETNNVSVTVYEKETFDIMLQTVHTQIHRLSDLFPSLKKEQGSLASDEVHAIKNARKDSILWLNEIVTSDDSFLREALDQEIANNRDFYTDIEVKEKFHGQFGSKYAKGEQPSRPTTWKGIVAGGEANVQFGNIYGL
ncbi:hypothetical protein TSTA_087480 [Talaromyces stipitatus ATCC 10500]|uniref:Prion-inhibition and propagation HeLo domain-containing protein n=1 Tax=Talaromyces stipitatus (strain ATCC 10500 / CBS 375.48 / QM 6759 / NRRL 1006) TaxID=441959 RepID=B8M248_TALSN|nr:uncharacterized protein TSTA_087480 [Talaromyces stipitatus ATCC 10500]EED21512.1 hypothetical protein TSTA_087480 [Talaromyces stipitatus ATCC 10500]